VNYILTLYSQSQLRFRINSKYVFEQMVYGKVVLALLSNIKAIKRFSVGFPRLIVESHLSKRESYSPDPIFTVKFKSVFEQMLYRKIVQVPVRNIKAI
jgi:hypothetical protein